MFNLTKKTVMILLFIGTVLIADNKELPKNEISKIEQLEIFKKANIKILKAYDAGSLYILSIKVQGSNDEIYLTKDKKYIISGAVVNVSNQMQLSAPVDLSTTKDKEGFVYGTGKDEYVLFTDPECPFCKKFESYLPQIKDKVKIRVFFYPLEFHENAHDLSLYILSQKTTSQKIDALYEFNIGDNLDKVKNAKYSKSELAKLEKQLNEQMNIATNLNIQGTPALFDKNGNSIIWVNMLEKYGIEVR
ncbi:thioredoxin fold domain-containing protein [Arcobacter lacus]|uniref:Thiol:disulfide interchange protein n=1 Tax=Arcobacter lacus TaxID=1912876 RepID=A0ABX5JMQ2_9BACT|nr:thioredoxin fold domain-containing protein [Arcobacter lacus]PUE66353.1 thiol:disulfide interchange protein [Arcobacter lacus]